MSISGVEQANSSSSGTAAVVSPFGAAVTAAGAIAAAVAGAVACIPGTDATTGCAAIVGATALLLIVAAAAEAPGVTARAALLDGGGNAAAALWTGDETVRDGATTLGCEAAAIAGAGASAGVEVLCDIAAATFVLSCGDEGATTTAVATAATTGISSATVLVEASGVTAAD